MKKALTTAFIFFFSIAPLSPVFAQTKEFSGACLGTGDASGVATIQGVECLLANVLASAVTVVGIVAFVIFLVGGFQILTSGNNQKGMEQGKNSITAAIIGIVIALASILVLNVISGLTGVKTILKFSTQYQPPKEQR